MWGGGGGSNCSYIRYRVLPDYFLKSTAFKVGEYEYMNDCLPPNYRSACHSNLKVYYSSFRKQWEQIILYLAN